MLRLPQDRLLLVHEAAIACGFGKEAAQELLLAGLPPGYVASLPDDGVPSTRLLRVLDRLNQHGRLRDGTDPLERWLRNAIQAAREREREEAEVFEEALRLRIRGAAPIGPNGKASPTSASPSVPRQRATAPLVTVLGAMFSVGALVLVIVVALRSTPVAQPVTVAPAPPGAPPVSVGSAAPGAQPMSVGSAAPQGMALISGGAFRMGSDASEIGEARQWCATLEGIECREGLLESEGPVRQVTVSAFYLDRTEVTNQRFADWLNTRTDFARERNRYVCASHQRSPSGARGACGEGTLVIDLETADPRGSEIVYSGRFAPRAAFELRPVVQVSRWAAGEYCRARSHGRLPTEAEWEFAARGPARRRFSWGDDLPRCEGTAFGRRDGMVCASLPKEPVEVGTSMQDRTPEDVTELAGNVAEWVADGFRARYDECPPPCVDPVRPFADGDQPAFRGGSWNSGAATARAVGRGRGEPDKVRHNIGFRCAAPATAKGDER